MPFLSFENKLLLKIINDPYYNRMYVCLQVCENMNKQSIIHIFFLLKAINFMLLQLGYSLWLLICYATNTGNELFNRQQNYGGCIVWCRLFLLLYQTVNLMSSHLLQCFVVQIRVETSRPFSNCTLIQTIYMTNF